MLSAEKQLEIACVSQDVLATLAQQHPEAKKQVGSAVSVFHESRLTRFFWGGKWWLPGAHVREPRSNLEGGFDCGEV